MQGSNTEPLPPELDWNNMKDGIFDKIQALEQEASSQRNNRRSGRRTGLFILLFFVCTLGLFSFFQHMITDSDAESNNLVQFSENQKLADEQNRASHNNSDSTPPNREKLSGEVIAKENKTTNAKELSLGYEESEPNQDSRKYESPQTNRNHVQKGSHRNEKDPPNKFQDRAEATQRIPDTVKDPLRPLTDDKFTGLMAQIPELQTLPPYGFVEISLDKIQDSIFGIQKIDNAFRPRIRHDRSPDQLILEGGLTFWEEGFGNIKPERAQYESPLPSFQLQGHYMRSLNRNFFVMAGLQYQQLESKLRYNNTIQDYKVVIEDTIIQVQNNAITGEQRLIRGDVEQFVQAERRVRHYNKTQLFKLSLAIGKNWRFNSFQTDVYLGGALNTLVHNQGRMFYESEIMDYAGTSNSFFNNQWKVDGVLGARIHYFLNHSIGVNMGFQTQKSLMNWSNHSDINFYPVSFNMQLGLSYSL